MITKLDEAPHRLWSPDEFARMRQLGFFTGQQVELRDGDIWIHSPEGWQPWLWDKKDYYRLGDEGFFWCQRVELWEGEIVVMSPQGPIHYSILDRIRKVLERLLDPSLAVRMQGPLDLGAHTEPEPDIAIVPADPTYYRAGHPRTALLIVEVSDTSIYIDRGRKGSLYARAGIADYWVVSVTDDHLEVYRDPQPDPAQPYGHRYASSTVLDRAAKVSPLAAPQLLISVAELLG